MIKKTLFRICSILLALTLFISVVSVAFPVVSQAKEVSCKKCGGKGWYYCTVCSGLGWNRCTSCGGSGYTYGISGRSRCLMCSGRGKRSCRDCMGQGTVFCKTCGGEGFYDDGTASCEIIAIVGGFTFRWFGGSEYSSGFAVQYSTYSNFQFYEEKIVTDIRYTEFSIKGLEENQKYYIRFRTYVNNSSGGKTYHSWSSTKSVTTKIDTSTPPSTTLTAITANELDFTVSWQKQTQNFDGYQIQYSTNSTFESDTTTKTVQYSKTSLLVEGLNSNVCYYVRARTYRNGYDKTYYSDWSKEMSVVTKAFTPSATSIEAITAEELGFCVSWQQLTENVNGYQLQYALDSGFNQNPVTITINDNSQTSQTISALKSASCYFLRVRTYRTVGEEDFFSDWSETASVVTKAPAVPTTAIKTVTAEELGFRVSWNKQTQNANGYQIQYSTDSKFEKKTITQTVNDNSQIQKSLDGLKANQIYYVRVRTYRTVNAVDYYSAWSKAVSVKPKQVAASAATTLTKTAAKEAGFSVSWKKQTKNTNGYQIQYSTNSAFKKGNIAKTVNDSAKTSLLFTGLKENQRYYVRVRTFRTVNGEKYYSSWSKAKSIVTKKIALPKGTAIVKLTAQSKGFSVTWKKQTKNTNGYQIQYSTNKSFKNGNKAKTVKDNTATSLSLTDLKANQRYYVRVRTYRTVNGKNYYSAWSKALSVKTKKG